MTEDTKKYILNTTVGDYNKGNVVTEDEISKLLNIKQCIDCGWLIPEQSKLQSQDKQVGWEIVAVSNSHGQIAYVNTIPTRGAKIHSVRRNSDGEVFTVGDKVDVFFGENNRYKLNTTITGFDIKHGVVVLHQSGDAKFDKIQHPKPQPSSIDRIEPMPETKYMGSFEAYTSGVSYGVNWCKKYGIPKDLSEITSAKTTQPKEEDKPVIIEDNDRCGICGGEMVYIRGRYPNTDKRKVCPTCTTERLEQISDLCSPEYGKAYQNKN